HLADIRRESEQRHLALRLLHLFGHHEEDAQPGAADVIELCQIDGEMGRAAAERRIEPVLGRFGGAAVEAAGKPDDDDVARLFLGKFHEMFPCYARCARLWVAWRRAR